MIRLENVIKIYGEDYEKKIALNNICLEIKDGEFVAVTGPSGSGKSTLLNIIGLLTLMTSTMMLPEREKSWFVTT